MFKTIKTKEQLEQEKINRDTEQRIVELKKFLAETDYVALPDYDKEKTDILAERQKAREELRQLKGNQT